MEKSINIYNENWLPGKGSAKVVSPHAPALEGAQVAALINSDTRTWNQNMLQRHFLSFEADRIKMDVIVLGSSKRLSNMAGL